MGRATRGGARDFGSVARRQVIAQSESKRAQAPKPQQIAARNSVTKTACRAQKIQHRAGSVRFSRDAPEIVLDSCGKEKQSRRERASLPGTSMCVVLFAVGHPGK